jgi:hypothetical protein
MGYAFLRGRPRPRLGVSTDTALVLSSDRRPEYAPVPARWIKPVAVKVTVPPVLVVKVCCVMLESFCVCKYILYWITGLLSTEN